MHSLVAQVVRMVIGKTAARPLYSYLIPHVLANGNRAILSPLSEQL